MSSNVIGGPGHAIPLTAVLNATVTNIVCVLSARMVDNVFPTTRITTSNTPFTLTAARVFND